jgi:hypothetical protein
MESFHDRRPWMGRGGLLFVVVLSACSAPVLAQVDQAQCKQDTTAMYNGTLV